MPDKFSLKAQIFPEGHSNPGILSLTIFVLNRYIYAINSKMNNNYNYLTYLKMEDNFLIFGRQLTLNSNVQILVNY